jgi:hypothetical protein
MGYLGGELENNAKTRILWRYVPDCVGSQGAPRTQLYKRELG